MGAILYRPQYVNTFMYDHNEQHLAQWDFNACASGHIYAFFIKILCSFFARIQLTIIHIVLGHGLVSIMRHAMTYTNVLQSPILPYSVTRLR